MHNSNYGKYYEWSYFEEKLNRNENSKKSSSHTFLVEMLQKAEQELIEFSFLGRNGEKLSAQLLLEMSTEERYALMMDLGSEAVQLEKEYGQRIQSCRVLLQPLARYLPGCMTYYLLNRLDDETHISKIVIRTFDNNKLIGNISKLIHKLRPEAYVSQSMVSNPMMYRYELDSNTLILRDKAAWIPWQLRKWISNLVVEGTVEQIGDKFKDAGKLQKVSIDRGVTEIGEQAFADCQSLECVSLPDSVQKIGSCAFYGCESLQTLHVNPECSVIVEPGAFLGCPLEKTGNADVDLAIEECQSISLDARSLRSWEMSGNRTCWEEDEQILVHSLGSREADLAEARRRMDAFLSEFCKKNSNSWGSNTCRGYNDKGEWVGRIYRCTIWSETYYHYHDGECVRGDYVSIERISIRDFLLGKASAIPAEKSVNPFYRFIPSEFWKYSPELCADEGERYYLKYECMRVENFLGMQGFFEIKCY